LGGKKISPKEGENPILTTGGMGIGEKAICERGIMEKTTKYRWICLLQEETLEGGNRRGGRR